MDKKKIIIVIAVVIVLYLLYKSSSSASTSKDQKDASGTTGDLTDSLASSISTLATATNVNKSVEDEYYQDLLAEYRRLNGGILPRGATSLTASQLEKEIAVLKELQKAINEYYEIENDEVQMTANKLREKGIDTIEEIQTLIKEVKLRQRREKWDQRKRNIEILVNAFYSNMTNVGTWLGDCKGYDTETFKALVALSQNEKVYANQYFGTLGGVNVGSSWNKITKHPTVAYSISEAIPQLGESVDRDRASHSQVGKSTAMAASAAVKNEYANITGSVNQYGEIV